MSNIDARKLEERIDNIIGEYEVKSFFSIYKSRIVVSGAEPETTFTYDDKIIITLAEVDYARGPLLRIDGEVSLPCSDVEELVKQGIIQRIRD